MAAASFFMNSKGILKENIAIYTVVIYNGGWDDPVPFWWCSYPILVVLPGEGGKDGFHGSSKLLNTMPPPPPPKETFEICNVIYCCHKKAMVWSPPPEAVMRKFRRAGEPVMAIEGGGYMLVA